MASSVALPFEGNDGGDSTPGEFGGARELRKGAVTPTIKSASALALELLSAAAWGAVLPVIHALPGRATLQEEPRSPEVL